MNSHGFGQSAEQRTADRFAAKEQSLGPNASADWSREHRSLKSRRRLKAHETVVVQCEPTSIGSVLRAGLHLHRADQLDYIAAERAHCHLLDSSQLTFGRRLPFWITAIVLVLCATRRTRCIDWGLQIAKRLPSARICATAGSRTASFVRGQPRLPTAGPAARRGAPQSGRHR